MDVKPRLAHLPRDPWNMVIGSDSVGFVFYTDGLILFDDDDSPTGYFSVHLDDAELQQLDSRLPGKAFFDVKRMYDLAPTSTDGPLHYLKLWYGDEVKLIGVGGHPDLSPDSRHRHIIPDEVLDLFRLIASFKHPRAAPWLPALIEVMIWPFDHAREEGTPWPEGWPDFHHPETIRRGERSYSSVYIDPGGFDQLKVLRKGPVLLDDRKWSIAYRFPVPLEDVIRSAGMNP